MMVSCCHDGCRVHIVHTVYTVRVIFKLTVLFVTKEKLANESCLLLFGNIVCYSILLDDPHDEDHEAEHDWHVHLVLELFAANEGTQ